MHTYNLANYGNMINDSVRTGAYSEALRRAINGDSIVLDIGTGLGIFAMLACQFGARKVYALEVSDVIEIAKEIATINGFSNRIEFIRDLSSQITLPEPVDVIVSEIHGILPLFQHLVPSIADARRRLLKPGGTLIPKRESLWVTLVEAPELYRPFISPWIENLYGINMQPAHELIINLWVKGRVKPEQLLAEPQCWAVLEYENIEDPNVSAEVTWRITRAGVVHGLCLWFDSTLADDVSFSNAPGQTELIFGNAFFPLSLPVTLDIGDIVTVGLHANLVGEDYIWRWETLILGQGDSGCVKANFRQSNFFGAMLSREKLLKQANGYIPQLGEEGQATRFILNLMDGQSALDEIAVRLQEAFPASFVDEECALARVRELSKTYSR
ncbi:MAG: hypothetical protein AUG51_10285 [Acidobacteria bacterium 13_1_20CM_3_53_8]|nr:MAG: hypothetical protein AUG51_10285 [Acidobacteria bacterium 13_1_20CM_3_53_8]